MGWQDVFTIYLQLNRTRRDFFYPFRAQSYYWHRLWRRRRKVFSLYTRIYIFFFLSASKYLLTPALSTIRILSLGFLFIVFFLNKHDREEILPYCVRTHTLAYCAYACERWENNQAVFSKILTFVYITHTQKRPFYS